MPYVGVLTIAAGGGILVHWYFDDGPRSQAVTAVLLIVLGVVVGAA